MPVKPPSRRRLVVSDDEDLVESSPKKVTKPVPKLAPKATPAKNPKKRAPVESESEEDNNEPSDESSPKGKAEKRSTAPKLSPVRGALSGGKYTPLQMQVLHVKAKNPDVLLYAVLLSSRQVPHSVHRLVECGYKYRFFGHDAEVRTMLPFELS